MNKLKSLLIFIVCNAVLSACGYAQAANEGYILEGEGTRHLLSHPDPAYPPIAKAAHVQGSVLLHVSVDANGQVTHIEAIGGPPMLKGAAVEAVQGWTYRPFLIHGSPAAVKVIVTVPFSLGLSASTAASDEAVGQAYFPQSDICRKDNASGHWSEAIKSCESALKIALRFPDPSQRYNELRTAHEEYGEALLFGNQASEALKEFRESIDIAHRSLKETDEEYGSAYYWLAFTEQTMEKRAEADQDYITAEKSFRLAIANLPDMKKPYRHALAQCLLYHALDVLQLGDVKRANSLGAEAREVDPDIAKEMSPKQ